MNLKSEFSGKLYKFLIMILTLISVRMIFYYAFTDFLTIISRVPDDASYYLKIAQNFNNGLGFSFDGISRTSGFQPLWQYVLIGFTFLIKTTPEVTLRAVMILQVIILYISSLIFTKILKLYFDNGIVFSGGLIFMIFVYFPYLNAMETPLMILIILALFFFILKAEVFTRSNIKKEFISGVLLGLLMMARLDTVFFAVILFSVFFFIVYKSKKNYSGFLVLLFGFLVVTLPYLIFNQIYFGNIIPVSGYLKSTFPATGLNENFSELIQYREMFFAAASIYFVFFYLVNYRRIKVNQFSAGLAVMAAGNILLMLYIIFFMNWVIFPWYFTTFSIFFSFFICLIFKYILSANIFNTGKLIFKILSVFIILFWGIKIYNNYKSESGYGSNWNVQSYKAAQWAKSETEESDLFAMKDAGHFSYFSQREVINLDGLVNSYEFQDILRDKKLKSYFTDHNVKYLVQHAVWNRDDVTDGNYDTLNFRFISHRYSVLSDEINVSKQNEVYRSDIYFDGPYRTVFLIWGLNK